MKDGWMMLTDRSETTGKEYFGVTKGFKWVYFRSDTYTHLLHKELIYQQRSHPYAWKLTEKAFELIK